MSRKVLPFLNLLLVFVLLACSGREESTYSSPSQVVEAFFKALDAKDYETAYSLQTKEFQNQMPLEIFSSSIEQGLSEYGVVAQTHEIIKEEVKDDLAHVSYRIISFTKNGEKIEGKGVYTLKKEGKQWKIDLMAATP